MVARMILALAMQFIASIGLADQPVVFKPHPDTGKFRLQRDADKPILAFYGGIGLRKDSSGRWNGYGQSSEDDVKYLINRMRESGMSRVYASFQEELYPSAIIPRKPAGVDFVKRFVELAHQNKIEVYGDMACFGMVEAVNANFVKANADAFTRDRDGKADTHMLSPAYPHVRRHKREVLMEYVQNYPLDGLALDFIRYPFYAADIRGGFGVHGYDEPALKIFRERFGYDSKYLPQADDPRWKATKAEQVNTFIREVRADLKAAGVKLPICAFNSGHYGARDSLDTVSQDWLSWETQGLVDEHAPMILMTHGMRNLVNSTRELVRIKRPTSLVMGPIFLDAPVPPTPDQVRDAARRLIKLGCDGLWFCRAQEIEQYDLWPVVKEISQWSIAKIRAEEFDPAYENILKNGDFENGIAGWTISPDTSAAADAGRSASGKHSLKVTLSSAPTSVSQKIAFQSPAYHSVDSLLLKVQTDTTGATVSGQIALELLLTYVDGEKETLSRSMDVSAGWKTLSHTFKVGTDHKKHILESADVRIVLPPGSGSVTLDAAEMERDPLLDSPGFR